MRPLIFVPSKEDKDIAEKYCKDIIGLLSAEKRVEMKAFILQQLIFSFQDASGLDIMNSMEMKK